MSFFQTRILELPPRQAGAVYRGWGEGPIPFPLLASTFTPAPRCAPTRRGGPHAAQGFPGERSIVWSPLSSVRLVLLCGVPLEDPSIWRDQRGYHSISVTF